MTSEKRPPHIPALDGLRGIAILLVVFYHSYDFVKPSALGWLGVDIFFVLSGYLITTILIDTVGQPNFLKNFYIRRILRIFPLYYSFIFFFLIIFPLLANRSIVQYYIDNQIYIWTYLQNWLYAFHFPANASLLNHLWSLAVEEQFYLCWPLLILLIKKPKTLFFVMLFILILVMGMRIALILTGTIGDGAFFPFTRVDGLCIGALVALLHKRHIHFLSRHMALVVTGIAGLNFIFYFFNAGRIQGYPYFFFIGYTTFTALFGLLVHEIVMNKTPMINKPLSFAPLRFIGRISYGFYLFHWPCFVLLTPLLRKHLGPHLSLSAEAQQYLFPTLSVLVAFVISIISYYGFERIFLRLKKNFA